MALNKKNGRKVWTTSLPKTGYSVVSVLFENDRLFCASGGRVFALDPGTDKIKWSNALKGMGAGLVYLSTVNSNNTEAIMTLFAQAQADSKQRAKTHTPGT